MNIHWHRGVDEIDAVFTPSDEWDFEMLQLSPGLLGYRSCTVELPGLLIILETLTQPIRSFQKMRQRAFYAGFVLRAPRPIIWKGQEVKPDNALVFGNVGHDLVLPERCLILNLHVVPNIANEMGLVDIEPGLWSCKPSALRAFMTTCGALTDQTTCPKHWQSLDESAQIATSQLVLSQFLAALGEPTLVQAARRYEIMHQAEKFASEHGWDDGLGIDRLADAIGVPRRTVHRSFKEIYGMGPQGFLRLVRLHQFRKALIRGDSIGVTEAALGAGFDHFGRAAQYYRQQFGELPKQTLKRAL